MISQIPIPADILQEIFPAQEIFVVAPYVTTQALQWLLDAAGKPSSFTLVTRWLLSDLHKGVSNIEVGRIVNQIGGTFRLHPTVHAKYYRCDQKTFIGSANLTMPGLGLAEHFNLELLHAPASTFNAPSFEEYITTSSHIVSSIELAVWERLVENTSSLDVDDKHLLVVAQWLPATREPRDLWILYRGEGAQLPSTDQIVAAERDQAALGQCDASTLDEFLRWLSEKFLLSSRVQQLLIDTNLESDIPATIIHSRAQEWQLSEAEVRRYAETVQIWHRALFHRTTG